MSASLSSKILIFLTILFLCYGTVFLILMSPHNSLDGRGGAKLPMASLGDSGILQIELARNENDLKAILLVGNVARNIQDARAGNSLDTFGFIPAYSGFFLSLGFLLRLGTTGWVRTVLLVALIAVPFAAVLDEVENHGIEATLNHIQHDGAPHLGDAVRISDPSMVKWLLIVVISFGLGAGALGKPKIWRVVVGALLLVQGLIFSIMLIRYAAERFA